MREELGLAYAVFAYKNFHQTSGHLGVYVGSQTASADQAVEAIRAEYDRLAREGLPAGELADGKQQLKGQIMLSLESPMARMGRLAGFSLHDDPYRPLDRMLAEIDAVTADDIAAVAAEFFPPSGRPWYDWDRRCTTSSVTLSGAKGPKRRHGPFTSFRVTITSIPLPSTRPRC